jgi:multicomponent Na+:H+ antiporter subunit G
VIYEAMIGVLAIIGSIFILIASIGIVRMPDLFLRQQVTSKASVMGLSCILLAVALYFSSTVVTLRVSLIVCFIVLTIPVATHMLARAGYTTDVPLSDETIINELIGQYDPRTHFLAGEEPTNWELEIPPDSAAIGKRVAELSLPADVLILAIHRHGEVVVPRGQTVIQSQDKLSVLARQDQLVMVLESLGIPAPAVVAEGGEVMQVRDSRMR